MGNSQERSHFIGRHKVANSLDDSHAQRRTPLCAIRDKFLTWIPDICWNLRHRPAFKRAVVALFKILARLDLGQGDA